MQTVNPIMTIKPTAKGRKGTLDDYAKEFND
jgi:hypothetical protein